MDAEMNQTPQITVTAILPPPFAWRAVPAGSITLRERGGYLAQPMRVDVAAFNMARYPVTNGQFARFVTAADGYDDERWWTFSPDAAEWHLENPQAKAVDYGADDHPRTHVAWYEAVAFCRWLSARTGQAIRLPSEAEWQRAAQGDDGRQYPWGDEWDAGLCHNNTGHENIGPYPVLDYASKGGSPFGVADMAGNVWEWCATRWNTGTDDLNGDAVRVLRGGSWFDDVQSFFRVTARSSWNPGLRSDLRGFRIVSAAL